MFKVALKVACCGVAFANSEMEFGLVPGILGVICHCIFWCTFSQFAASGHVNLPSLSCPLPPASFLSSLHVCIHSAQTFAAMLSTHLCPLHSWLGVSAVLAFCGEVTARKDKLSICKQFELTNRSDDSITVVCRPAQGRTVRPRAFA